MQKEKEKHEKDEIRQKEKKEKEQIGKAKKASLNQPTLPWNHFLCSQKISSLNNYDGSVVFVASSSI